MKVLFSPSESKIIPQEVHPIALEHEALYEDYLTFLQTAPEREIAQMMGYKQIQTALDLLPFFRSPPLAQKAILLYDGVAYDALGYAQLTTKEQDWILNHVYIFSNLFGMVQAGAYLPFYKLKQGEGFAHFKTQALYEHQRDQIQKILKEERVVDLRAEFYKKLYSHEGERIEFEFYKNGKRLSHHAKYYRGIVLRELSKNKGIEGVLESLEKMGLWQEECKKEDFTLRFSFCIP